MARQIIPLTDRKIRSLKPAKSPIREFDGNGLYIEVLPSGKKVWRFKSRLRTGKDILMTLGEYPIVPLSEARQKRDEVRRIIASGGDPRISDPDVAHTKEKDSVFRSIALEWHETRKYACNERHSKAVLKSLQKYIFPTIGETKITDLTPRNLLLVFQNIEKTGYLHTAVRVRSYCSRIFSYAVSLGLIERNPVSELGSLLRKPEHSHFSSIRKEELKDFLVGLNEALGHALPSTAVAMLLGFCTGV